MAKRGSKSSQAGPTQPNPQGANEALVRPVHKPLVTANDAMVNPMQGYPEAIVQQTEAFNLIEGKFNLADAEQAMRSVQLAQRNLTEALNKLSIYRKEVAKLLEKRRLEAAAARREALKDNPAPLSGTSVIKPKAEEPEPGNPGLES